MEWPKGSSAGCYRVSYNALDLLRAFRCTTHSTFSDGQGSASAFELYGRGVEVRDLEERLVYGEALHKNIDFKPGEPAFKLFGVEIESTAYAAIGDEEWFCRI